MIKIGDESEGFRAQAEAADRMLVMHARIWPAVIVLLSLIGLHAFHRVLGPLIRFQRAFGQIGQGELNFRIKLRKGDLLVGEEMAFNEMMDVLEEKINTSQKACHEALESLNALEPKIDQGEQATRESIQAQRKNLETLRENVGYFQIQKEQELLENS